MNLAILLSTYNGAKYLGEQLDSLIGQSYRDFTLYIRDDGSSDDTLDILAEYESRYSNIVLMSDAEKHRGAKGSFIWMLEHITADYYMFCDQDDVWLPSKVERSLDEMRKIERVGESALVFTDLRVVDESLRTIDESMWRAMKMRPDLLIQRRYAVSMNIFTGCTMLINHSAKLVALPMPQTAAMHDSWIGLRVIVDRGAVGYVDEPMLLYRQHGANVCGAAAVKIDGGHYLDRVLNVGRTIKLWCLPFDISNRACSGNLNMIYYLFWRLVYIFIR